VLAHLYSRTRTANAIGPHDGWRFFADPLGGRLWILAASLALTDRETASGEMPGRADRASTRRSVRALHERGLVECQMLEVVIPQQGLLYDSIYDVTRRALVVRLTDEGLDFVGLHGLTNSYY
jgi:hypothetical protein